MKDAIGYPRVSPQEQGRSGAGLAARRHEIDAFCVARRFRKYYGLETVPDRYYG